MGLNHPHAHIFIDFATRFMLLKVEYSMDFGFVATPPSKNRPLERPSSAREVKKARSFEWRVASRARPGGDPCSKGAPRAICIVFGPLGWSKVRFGTLLGDLRLDFRRILGLKHPHVPTFIEFATRFMFLKVLEGKNRWTLGSVDLRLDVRRIFSSSTPTYVLLILIATHFLSLKVLRKKCR